MVSFMVGCCILRLFLLIAVNQISDHKTDHLPPQMAILKVVIHKVVISTPGNRNNEGLPARVVESRWKVCSTI